jgi:hypothetical protein
MSPILFAPAIKIKNVIKNWHAHWQAATGLSHSKNKPSVQFD